MDEQEEHDRLEPVQSFTPIKDAVDAPVKHSGLGIASFIMSIISIIAYVGLTVALVFMVSNTIDFTTFFDANGQRTMTDQQLVDKLGPLIGYLVLYPLIFVINIIGLILGIIGLARHGYKKVFAIIGTVLNGLPLLSVFLLMIIGFAQVNR
jgi:hypothetical protein